MDLILLLDKINGFRNSLIDQINGSRNLDLVNAELANLISFVKDEKPPLELKKPKCDLLPKEQSPKLSGLIFLNSANKLLFKLEENKSGWMMQESNGFAIAVKSSDLGFLREVKEIKDSKGLSWKIELTNDLKLIKATNQIGDSVYGLKDIQILIDGEEPQNGSL